MLCDRCNKRDSTIHIRGIDNKGNSHSLNLCASCAKKELGAGQQIPAELSEAFRMAGDQGQMEMLRILADLIERAEIEGLEGTDDKKKCSNCKLTKRELRKKWLLSCPECFKTFKKEIAQFLKQNENFVFTEKMNMFSEFSDDLRSKQELAQDSFKRLNQRFQNAVKAEDYEMAASLKKELDKMQDIFFEQGAAASSSADWGAVKVYDEFENDYQLKTNLAWLPKCKSSDPLIRLASLLHISRNLASYALSPFKSSLSESEELCSLLGNFIRNDSIFGKVKEFDPQLLDSSEKVDLSSRGWCPYEFLYRDHTTRLFVSENERIIALLNNEDHLRVNLWGEADDLGEMLKQIYKFAEELEKSFALLKNKEFGYFSRNLHLIGNGIGMAQLLHLPALSFTDQSEALIRSCSEMNFHLRPLFGKEDEFTGAFYILIAANSFANPLLQAEELLELSRILENHELNCRNKIKSDEFLRSKIIDIVGRATGILRGMHLLDVNEAKFVLSALWLGIEFDMLPWLSYEQIFQKLTELLTDSFFLLEKTLSKNEQLKMRIEWAEAFKRDLLPTDFEEIKTD